MLQLLHVTGTPGVPLKVTVLEPWVSPKLVPVIATVVPTTPELADMAVITGITIKDRALLAAPLTVTTTSTKPGARELGTGATIFVSLHELGVEATLPKVTVLLLPCVAPKPDPLMVTDPPTGLTGPTEGEMLVILGTDCAWHERKTARTV